ncbi:hypothetical protein BKA56DRAFT_672330 [Ilyonectria sp. MPI-CAGE-AT-0026]|nr:hypothetical protein BKA56DRAFT_672330 [Ilyonectria sp. MPI-CAGE-AT-0026]
MFFMFTLSRVLSVGVPLLEVYELKSFWRFYKDQSRGRLDKRPTVQSLLTQAKALKAGLARLTKGKISDEDTEEINAWIKYVLPCEERSDVRDIRFNHRLRKLSQFVRHLNIFFGPEQLRAAGIEFEASIQGPAEGFTTEQRTAGQQVITRPNGVSEEVDKRAKRRSKMEEHLKRFHELLDSNYARSICAAWLKAMDEGKQFGLDDIGSDLDWDNLREDEIVSNLKP